MCEEERAGGREGERVRGRVASRSRGGPTGRGYRNLPEVVSRGILALSFFDR